MARDNHVRIDRIDVCADETNLVVNAGTLPFTQWCERRGLCILIDQRVPLCSERDKITMQDMKSKKEALHDTQQCLRALRNGTVALQRHSPLRCSVVVPLPSFMLFMLFSW